MPPEHLLLKPKEEDFLVSAKEKNGRKVLLPSYYSDAVPKLPEEYDEFDLQMIEQNRRIKELFKDNPLIYKKLGKSIPMKSELYNKEYALLQEAYQKWKEPYLDDWERCDFGESLDKLGFTSFLSSNTYYGDWSCTTYESKTQKELGEFCADAGMVCVVLLDEVLKYNPDFNYHIEKPWTTTLIKDFKGEISLEIKEIPYEYEGKNYSDKGLSILGTGNINFFTSQTGL